MVRNLLHRYYKHIINFRNNFKLIKQNKHLKSEYITTITTTNIKYRVTKKTMLCGYHESDCSSNSSPGNGGGVIS